MWQELRGPAVFRVFNCGQNFNTRVIYPETFFMAAGELLIIMLGVSWTISLIVQPKTMDAECQAINPDQTTFECNALKNRIGYNNLCVGFDTVPAKYIAAIVYVFMAYCGIRYSWLDLQRTQLTKVGLSGCKVCFSVATDILYVFAWAGFTLTYVIPPWENVWGHSIGFICLGFTTWLVLLANVMEGQNFPCVVYVFVMVFGLFTLVDFGCIAIANFIYYQATDHKKPPLFPWQVGMIADYGWLCAMGLTSVVMPKGPGLQMSVRTVQGEVFGKGVAAQDEEATGGWCGGEDDDDDDEL